MHESSLDAVLKEMSEGVARDETIVRTIDMTAINDSTRYTIVLALGQGLDESPVVDPPNQRDTGVTVVGQNVLPQQRAVTPLQPGINVKSTRVRFSFRWRHNPSGQEGDVNLPDQVAQPGYYYPHPAFGIKDPSMASLRGYRDPATAPPPEVWLSLAPLK